MLTVDGGPGDVDGVQQRSALVLVGVFKTDDLQVKYNLRFVQNDNAWKMIGVNVDATKKKQ